MNVSILIKEIDCECTRRIFKQLSETHSPQESAFFCISEKIFPNKIYTQEGVSNDPIQFKSARKIWPLLELLAKIYTLFACSQIITKTIRYFYKNIRDLPFYFVQSAI